MTICLGILCDKAKSVVVASDRMLTGADVEFEQDNQKIHLVTGTCVILSAGSALQQVDLLRKVCGELCNHRSPSISDVVKQVKSQWVEARNERAEELHLKPLGLDLGQFIQNQGRLSESLSLRLIYSIEKQALELELLIAGVDSAGGHVYYVHDPGVAECFDAVAFCAIGSGERHAELSFIRSGYSSNISLNRAVFLAYQAKRDSEVAPGVGARYTDIAIINEQDIRFVHEDTLKELSGAYERLMKVHSTTHTDIQASIDALKLKWTT